MIKKDINYYTNDSEYLQLNPNEMDMLKELLSKYMIPYINDKIPYCKMKKSSYGWKHTFEKICGFYISNVDFKEAMKQLGVINYVEHEVGHFPSINCQYAISKPRIDFLDGFKDLFSGHNPLIYMSYKPTSQKYKSFTEEYNMLKQDVDFLKQKYNVSEV